VKAKSGEGGKGKVMTGAGGADAIMKVPVGTEIYEEDGETLIVDMATVGQRYRLLKGGNGGFGNYHFKSATNQAPEFALPGQPAEERIFILKLKLIADAGLIGMPNAGKSTFLSRVSAARPKIADYPFTTLEPSLGIVRVDEGESFVIADLPGLIEGAAEGKGLGHRFLRHTERTRLLVHLVDLDPSGGRDPVADWKVIQRELAAYSEELAARPQIVLGSKAELPGTEGRRKKVERFCATRQLPFRAISSVTGMGLTELVAEIGARLRAERWAAAER